MASDSIQQFLQDIGAVVPAEFTTDIDDALEVLANSVAYLVEEDPYASTPEDQNVNYTRVDPTLKVSSSEDIDNLPGSVAEPFPMHTSRGIKL